MDPNLPKFIAGFVVVILLVVVLVLLVIFRHRVQKVLHTIKHKWFPPKEGQTDQSRIADERNRNWDDQGLDNMGFQEYQPTNPERLGQVYTISSTDLGMNRNGPAPIGKRIQAGQVRDYYDLPPIDGNGQVAQYSVDEYFDRNEAPPSYYSSVNHQHQREPPSVENVQMTGSAAMGMNMMSPYMNQTMMQRNYVSAETQNGRVPKMGCGDIGRGRLHSATRAQPSGQYPVYANANEVTLTLDDSRELSARYQIRENPNRYDRRASDEYRNAVNGSMNNYSMNGRGQYPEVHTGSRASTGYREALNHLPTTEV